MKRSVRIFLSMALCFALSLSLCLPGFAAESTENENYAQALGALGLLKGTDKGYELDKSMTRMEALIMMIRLTGNEWTALYGEWDSPFEDTPTWEGANEYAGYGYDAGLITGVSETKLDPNAPVSEQMFMTLLLRALGYADGETTVWQDWKTLAAAAGLPLMEEGETFLRGNMAELCWKALDAEMQDSGKTLGDTLKENNVYSELSLSIANVLMGRAVSAESELRDIAGAVYAGVEDTIPPSYLTIYDITEDNMASFLGVDNLKIEEAIGIEPMFTARAHSVCLIRMKDGQDIEKAKQEILDNVDPFKWICVGVMEENIRIASIGNLICLVMDNGAPDELMGNFEALDKTKPDANGMMQVNGVWMEAGKATNADYVRRFAEKLVSVREDYIPHNDVFYAVVPDKSYYAREAVTEYFDHEAIRELLAQSLPGWNEIDLTDTLSLDDYYVTDPHWRQERLGDTVAALGGAMGFNVDWKSFEEHSREGFIGSYSRKTEGLAGESVSWLTGTAIDAAEVENFQHPDVKTVYESARLDTKNPYDFFLSGATPLQTIRNSGADTDRRLIIFRDSFGSSIAPLLAGEYAEITLIDLRYMASSLLPQYVDFENADVLFLYSDALINNLLMLK
ncbi:MAG: hypothetical protein ACOX81_03080 [Candidatus Heteroscillospira sp.]|jgi:hypothetical protein